MSLKAFLLKKRFNLWPPFIGMGAHVDRVSKDLTSVDVSMNLHWWNKNHAGIQYGGSLYSMTDPFLGTIIARNLGKDYYVVDKDAFIDYKKPGKGTVTAHFNISAARIKEIKEEADRNFSAKPKFTVDVLDTEGQVVATVHKTVYVRRKDKKPIHGYKPPKPKKP